MVSIVFLSLLLASVSLSKRVSKYEEAAWELVVGEQPEDSSYEYRRYFPAMWASSDVTGVDFDKMGSQAYWRLHSYLNGENDQNLSMWPMTVPVTTTFRARPCPFCNVTFTMHLYIPMEFQHQPPMPTNPLVRLESVPETSYYVRRFGGIAKANDWRTQTSRLFSSLKTNQVLDIDPSAFLAAGYDGPEKLSNRRNEVWLWKGMKKLRFD